MSIIYGHEKKKAHYLCILIKYKIKKKMKPINKKPPALRRS